MKAYNPNMHSSKESIIKKYARKIVFSVIDIASLLFHTKTSQPPTIEDTSQILLIELAMLGDLLISSPLYYSIRKTFPFSYITIICTPWSRGATAKAKK